MFKAGGDRRLRLKSATGDETCEVPLADHDVAVCNRRAESGPIFQVRNLRPELRVPQDLTVQLHVDPSRGKLVNQTLEAIRPERIAPTAF